jgi:DNA-binding transcriptional MerR regulator
VTSARDYMTIGEVVDRLGGAYPDLSISKLRFLEDEGLVTPERTPGGYRKFTSTDVARLEIVLRLQKDHFLPLAVIREKLADFDRGRIPPELRQTVPSVAEPLALPLDEAATMPLEDAPNVLGVPVSFIRELAGFGLVEIVKGDHGDELPKADTTIVHATWDLRRFGVEPRHLRMYETFADREAAFFQQILMPSFMNRTPETRQKLVEALSDLTSLSEELKGRLLRRALGRLFEDLG